MEELRAGFVAQKKELEDEYQKQVDNMILFGYRCYMKKHGITQDTPNYLSDNKNIVVGGSVQGDGDTTIASSTGG